MKPTISVIMPVFNGARFLRRSINSVLAQTFSEFELIIVDDGSTDESNEIISKEVNDPRIRMIRQNNAGVSSARNRGILSAQGEYIALLDVDDSWDPPFLDAIVSLIKQYPEAGIFATGYRMVFSKGPNVAVSIGERGNQGPRLVSDYFVRAANYAFIHTSGIAIPRPIFSASGTFLAGAANGEDLEMWARIALRYPIAYDPRILFSFYQTGFENKPRYSKILIVDPVLSMLNDRLARQDTGLHSEKEIKHYMGCYYRRMIQQFIRMNDRDGAIRYAEQHKKTILGISANWLQRIPVLWLFPRVISLISRARCSRIALRMRRGFNQAHELVQH